MKVQIVAYKNRLIMVPNKPEEGIGKDGGWYPSGDGRLGCVVTDTKTRLGVSEEAFELMKGIKRNHDAIGDLSWWECDDGTYALAYFGSIHRVIDPETAEGDRDFRVTPSMRNACTIIPNDVPEEVKAVLDAMKKDEEVYAWKEPHRLDGVTVQGHEDDEDDEDEDSACDCGHSHCE
jgi:hypothetical protein